VPTPPRGAQVVDVSTSKTGKHGHAKCHFVALDIFTSRKMEELVPSSHNLEARGCTSPPHAAGSHGCCGGPRCRRSWRAAAAARRVLAELGQTAGCRHAARDVLTAACPQVPHVSRQDYSLLDISDDGFVSTQQPRR